MELVCHVDGDGKDAAGHEVKDEGADGVEETKGGVIGACGGGDGTAKDADEMEDEKGLLLFRVVVVVVVVFSGGGGLRCTWGDEDQGEEEEEEWCVGVRHGGGGGCRGWGRRVGVRKVGGGEGVFMGAGGGGEMAWSLDGGGGGMEWEGWFGSWRYGLGGCGGMLILSFVGLLYRCPDWCPPMGLGLSMTD